MTVNTFLLSTIHLNPRQIEVHFQRELYDQMKSITSARDVYEVLKTLVPPTRIDVKEFFWVFYLTNSNRLIASSLIGIGSVKGVAVNLIEIFQQGFAIHASVLILAHNHPGGNLEFSSSDLKVTRKIKSACHLLDMTLLDHVVFSSESFRSMAESGEL